MLVRFSTTFHPAKDGQTEHTIQTLEDMLRACTLDYKSAWDEQLALAKLSYKNCYHSSIGIARMRHYMGGNGEPHSVGKRLMKP